MLLNKPEIFASLTICLLASVSACANNPASKELEQIFAADPQLKNNPPFNQLIQNTLYICLHIGRWKIQEENFASKSSLQNAVLSQIAKAELFLVQWECE